MYLDPTNALIAGYTVTDARGEKKKAEVLEEDEGILYADLNISECIAEKQFHDVVGGSKGMMFLD